jgi:hypothetical protein
MKIKNCFLVLTLILIMYVSESSAQQLRQDVGTKLLIPSSARTATFTSLLVVLNLDTQPNNVTIIARRADGSLIGVPLGTTIPVGGRFRSTELIRSKHSLMKIRSSPVPCLMASQASAATLPPPLKALLRPVPSSLLLLLRSLSVVPSPSL